MQKDFDSWNLVKKQTESKNRPNIKSGDIFWCRIGKNNNFVRPVVILKKFSNQIILGCPLTTKQHDGNWYYKFQFNNMNQWAILNQTKPIDTKRLENKIGTISENKLKEILIGYINLISSSQNKTLPFGSVLDGLPQLMIKVYFFKKICRGVSQSFRMFYFFLAHKNLKLHPPRELCCR